MPTSAAPTDDLINPETGQPVDLDEIKFVSLTGNQLTVYLPEELEWYRGPDGERRAREIGGNAVNFQHGIFPAGDQSASYENVKLLLEHEHYGDLFKIAADSFDVDATGGELPDHVSESGPQPGEGQVMLNGRLVSKEEALAQLERDDMEATATEEIDEVPTESQSDTLEVLSAPTNKTDALEALAEEGVDLSGAPSASATAEEIQRFAVDHGYVIEKYDLPE